MRSISFSRSFLLYLLFTSYISLLSATAYSVDCGDTIGPGGRYSLNKDLKCEQPITLIGPAVFDMKGHKMDGSDNKLYYRGLIIVEGKNARLLNGHTYYCHGPCITLGGEGFHSVSRMNINIAYDGIDVLSNHNTLYRNTVTDTYLSYYIAGNKNKVVGNVSLESLEIGYVITGMDNRISHNNSTNSYWMGFSTNGNRNHLSKNIATGSIGNVGFYVNGIRNTLSLNIARDNNNAGFDIHGEQNTLLANRSELNTHNGIRVGAVNSLFIKNTSIDNGDGSASFDIFEINDNCDSNTWKKNYFYTANQDCID